jgi:predicted transcriptional regulator
MQKANLSYNNLQKCLEELESLGLVALQPETYEYATTKKGVTFLAKWGQLQRFLTPEEKLSIKTKRRYSSAL